MTTNKANCKIEFSRFNIINIEDMLKYEKTDRNRVSELVKDITAQNKLINPIIYDPKLKLLIDGHHRVEAFKLIGLNSIATYNVNYFSEEVSVKEWYRILSGINFIRLENIFNCCQSFHLSFPKKNIHHIKIVLEGDEIIKQISFSDPIEASNCLQKICDLIIKNSGEVNLSVDKISCQNSIESNFFLFLKPDIGKNQVFNVAKSNKSFNVQVNRHLINNRPLGMDIPIDIFNLPITDSKNEFHKHLRQSNQISIQGKRFYEGRFYEEDTILFSFNKNI